MYQTWTLFVALRYLRTRRNNRFASFVSVVSIAGIAVGVAALTIVLSVMNGFEREVTRHVLGMSSHAVLLPPDGVLIEWPFVRTEAEKFAPIVATSPYVRGSGMLSRKGEVRGVAVEGIVPNLESQVSSIESYLGRELLATLESSDNAVLIGRNLAADLGVDVGDTLTLVVADFDASGQPSSPRYARYRIAGLFHVGMHQYDTRLMLMSLTSAQSLFQLSDAVSGLRVRFSRPDVAPLASRQFAQSLSRPMGVIDWTQYHRNFFIALESQKRIMFIVLALIIAVAAFNIAANMVMVVAEKIRSIAILRTLGASRVSIIQLFLFQGTLIGVGGALLGAALGAWGASESEAIARFVESALDVDLINADVYFIDYLPARLDVGDVAAVVSVSILLSLLATLYPAWRAANINPAEAVHRD